MRANAYAPWELRSAILSGRAETLRETAQDKALPLSPEQRAALTEIAAALTAEAHRVVREG